MEGRAGEAERSRRFLAILLGLGCCLPLAAGHAATFNITPIRIELSADRPTSFLTLTNGDAGAKVIQVELMAWSQAEQRDVFTPSDDVVVNPPIFTVQPGKAQIVRLGLRRPLHADHELSYRIFLTEVPQPQDVGAQPLNHQLQMVMRLSVPVFVAAASKPAPTLRWKAAAAKDGAVDLTAVNTGNLHFQIREIELSAKASRQAVAKETGVSYLLPGQSWHWHLTPDARWRGEPLHLSAHTDLGDINEDIELH